MNNFWKCKQGFLQPTLTHTPSTFDPAATHSATAHKLKKSSVVLYDGMLHIWLDKNVYIHPQVQDEFTESRRTGILTYKYSKMFYLYIYIYIYQEFKKKILNAGTRDNFIVSSKTVLQGLNFVALVFQFVFNWFHFDTAITFSVICQVHYVIM